MGTNHETCLRVTTDILEFVSDTKESRIISIPSAETGDCQWRAAGIVLYSNGDYTDIVEIHDTGTWTGDRFLVTRTIMVDGAPVATWNWGEGPYCSNGRSRTVEFRGNHPGIASYFSSDMCIATDYRCSG